MKGTTDAMRLLVSFILVWRPFSSPMTTTMFTTTIRAANNKPLLFALLSPGITPFHQQFPLNEKI